MKIWDKGIKVDSSVEKFTIGKDREMDLLLAPYDVIGTMAHSIMLESIGLLTSEELSQLKKALKDIYKQTENNEFSIDEGVEDVHSQVEFLLTQQLGDTGKKVHSARSRNDQVLVDLKMFIREELIQIAQLTADLFSVLIELSEKNKDIIIPGYTHLQVAMPSSMGLWFGAFAEGLSDDLQMILAAFKIANQNPLGSAAGYGSSFPINRSLTTELLEFDDLNYNVVYAQMGRGKTERIAAQAMGSVAATLNKLASDACLFMNQNFNLFLLPDEFTTGSSIMPHKKNPDVFELIRAKTNKLISLSNELSLITTNLPSGYFRDMQIIKESFLPSFSDLKSCIVHTKSMMQGLKINKEIIQKDEYKYLFSVEELNKMVHSGVPFRDAYKQIAANIDNNEFDPSREVNHTHEGSIGNLCNDKITEKFNTLYKQFEADKILSLKDRIFNL